MKRYRNYMKYTANVIKQALENAAKNAEIDSINLGASEFQEGAK